MVEGSVSRRPSEYAEAFDGVDAVFLAGAVPATVGEVLDTARHAGVRRTVVLSSHGPEYEEAYPPETWFWLERSGMEWTHIRPSAVMGAVIEGTYPATRSDWARTGGVVREAFLNGGHYPFIHEDDLAAVAAAALRTDDHVGRILEVVGLPIATPARSTPGRANTPTSTAENDIERLRRQRGASHEDRHASSRGLRRATRATWRVPEPHSPIVMHS
ncbi:SDR family oxidoreductase [Streptomyces sp. NPDC059650]|uniref:SDR family oxidoreductase n=1 Tax=Streptomyces sp. NPDC059650 TaxID=3346896 RepID=UPI003685DDBA